MTLPIGLALAAPLAPLLWWQGRRVRRITPLLPEPPGRRQGRLAERLDGPPARLLLLGDSSAAGVGAPDQPSALSGQLLARLDSHLTRPLHWRLVQVQRPRKDSCHYTPSNPERRRRCTRLKKASECS